MENSIEKMILQNISDDSKVITLKHKEPFILGRTRETQIEDTRCSRTQLILTPDFEIGQTLIEQIGRNNSAINGIPLGRGCKRKINDDDLIEVLESKHFYRLRYKRDSAAKSESLMSSNSNKIDENKVKRIAPLDNFLKDSVLETNGSWKSYNDNSLLVYTVDGTCAKEKIAAFDLDGTIITTISGNVFPKNFDDWKLLFPNISDKLKSLNKDDFKLVFFTNQSGIGRGKVKVSDYKKKIEAIVRKLRLPIQIFIATKDDIFRKPRVGMWNHCIEKENKNVSVNMQLSFYCGDAAGRVHNLEPGKVKKDHSLADRLFALNLKLKFYTPEEYFLEKKPASFKLPDFQPTNLSNEPLLEPSTSVLTTDLQEIIVMIGCPASGKSFFAKRYLKSAGYAYVNRDSLKTWQKCVNMTEQSVLHKKSVVVDNTNPDKESRARYTKIGKDYNVPVRAFYMTTCLEHAKHNNIFRQVLNEEKHDFIPNHSINQFFKILEPPTLDEGFQEIVRVNFIPKFDNDVKRELYNSFLLEQ